jgi:hypothetical protein
VTDGEKERDMGPVGRAEEGTESRDYGNHPEALKAGDQVWGREQQFRKAKTGFSPFFLFNVALALE